ncbi:MAG: hypothetical protein LUD07_02565 [Clostridiales bacterium]|nr:hypothetical protein [Clostridiales bacterium]
MKTENGNYIRIAVLTVMICLRLALPTWAADGWKQSEEGIWIYYEQDKPVKNRWLQNEDGTWRYADGNGQMALGKFVTWEGEKYYLDAQGLRVEDQWFSVTSTVTEPSKKVTTTWYYAGEGGVIYRGGWLRVGEGEFYFGSGGNVTRNGVITVKEATGETDEAGEPVTIQKKYYIDEITGRQSGGWFSVDKTNTDGTVTRNWYYADAEGSLNYGGFFEMEGGTCYFDGNGIHYRDRWYTDPDTKERYYLDKEGFLQGNGWYTIVTTNASTGATTENWYYGDPSGSVAKGGFIRMGDHTYYFDANGRNYRKQWYVNPDTKERYYLDEEGILQTGWFDIITVNAKTGAESVATYYANADGSVWKGNTYLELDGKTYYFTTNGAISKKRWMVDAGKGRKYLGEDGALKINEWFSISGTSTNGADYTNWYYATDTGRVYRSGWHTVEDKEYYFNSSGVMQVGWVDGNDYYCGEDGAKVYGWQLVPLKDSWLVSTETELMEYVGRYGDTAWFYFAPDTGRVSHATEDTYKEIKVDGHTYCVDERGVIQQGWIKFKSKSPAIRGYKYYKEADYLGYTYAVTLVAGAHMSLADVRGETEKPDTATPSEASEKQEPEAGDKPESAPETLEENSLEMESLAVGERADGGWLRVVGPDADSTGDEEWFYFEGSGFPKSAASGKQELCTLDHHRYLINDQGNFLTGLREVNGAIYYFDETTMAAQTGKCRIDDGYSINTDGISTYYFKENGVGYTGLHGGAYYYQGKLQAADAKTRYQAFDLPEIGIRLLDEKGKIVRNRTVKDGNGDRWKTASSGEIIEYGSSGVSEVSEPPAENGD